LSNQQKTSAAAAYEHDSLLLTQEASARLQAETDLERTWKVSQDEIKESIGQSAASKSFSLRLSEFGPYEIDYTHDGRHLAIAGRKGHVATFDWQTGRLGTEVQLKETVRDIKWLHNTSFFAVAQMKYVYIYDSNGLEIHQLRNHIEVNRMEFLRYHFLLATAGNAGYLKYQDTSTGSVVAEHRSKLGACSTMAQNHHTGVISLGHANGTITMWTPNISSAQIKLLAHNGPVSAIASDPSSMGTYFATAGLDGTMKVWDARKWAVVNEWQLRRPASSLTYSQKGLLACGWGNHATIYSDSTKQAARAPGPYMTQLFPSSAVHTVSFCPFEDILGVGHAEGLDSLIIPGAGEANYDSLEADPYESKKSRREREVVSLLDKIQPDQIHLDPDLIGKLVEKKEAVDRLAGLGIEAKRLAALPDRKAKSFAEKSRLERLRENGQAEDAEDESEEEEEPVGPDAPELKPRKARGKNKVLKRVMRRRKNIIDEKSVRVKELIEERKQAALVRQKQHEKKDGLDVDGALARFA
jgi:U3 small nucleolar RNA-associated protein 7